jgi:glycosyltransferase involved in cell wall biosynthesis
MNVEIINLYIITTNRGGNSEVILDFDNGIVLNDYKNHIALAEKISFLINNPSESLKMGKKGR